MNLKNSNAYTFILLLAVFAGFLYFNGGAINQAPNIAVNTLTGEKISLHTLKGKPTLVTFWATDCPGCIKEIPHLKALHADYDAKGLNMIAIAMYYDRPDHVIAMTKDKQLPYKVALDPLGDAAKAFGNVRLTPTTFLIAPDGSIVLQKMGVFDEKDMRHRIDALLEESLGTS
ncbi:MAG: redoxin [Cycloclasticus sp. symbiont of Poecilosclerida sp. M]|nr:MAG: redoxin [Cycloclasticus sp. symbiont of Poecilosclerida sp. M]